MTDRDERECPICPPWVRRCGHWDGRVLVLGPLTRHPSHLIVSPWAIWSGTEWFKHNPPCVGCVGLIGKGETVECSNLPAAEAEFAKREAILLGRENE